MKLELALAMGVSQARVSQWLHRANAPNAEDALRLLEWVTAAEDQQKQTAAALRTPRRLKDPKSKSKTNERTKSDRSKD